MGEWIDFWTVAEQESRKAVNPVNQAKFSAPFISCNFLKCHMSGSALKKESLVCLEARLIASSGKENDENP